MNYKKFIKVKCILISIVSFILLGCGGYAKVIRRDMYGGVLALKGVRDKAMQDAIRKMEAHCGPNNYTIISEEEVPIGTRTTSRSTSSYDSRFKEDETKTEITTTQVTEYRITYRCGNVGSNTLPPVQLQQPTASPNY